MSVLLWSRAEPYRCCCGGTAYRPQLTDKGKLVKSRDPAWKMAEQTRDPGCLQERCRALTKLYRTGYQHHKMSKGSGAGYPDCHFWVPVRPGGGGSAYAELKRMGKNPTDVQVRVMGELLDAGHLVYLVRPCCLLTGAVDELLAALAGTRVLYAGGHPNGRPSVADVLEDMAATEPRPAAVVVPALLVRAGVLPGADPVPFAPAVGYVVPIPAGDEASTAVRDLEVWLRAAGFPITALPFPMRLVVGDGELWVHVRKGLARPGHDERVWRGGAPASPFPDHVVQPARARMVAGPSAAAVAAAIEHAPRGNLVQA